MRGIPLLAVLLAFSLSAAQAPDPPLPSEAQTASLAATYDLDLSVNGKGTEVVQLVREEGVVRLTSRAEVTAPQGALVLKQDSVLAGSPPAVTRYTVSIEAGGKPQGTVVATRREGSWFLEARAPEAPDAPQAREFPASGPSVVLDNFLPSQVDVFVRALDLAAGGETTVLAVVPQALVAAPMKVRRLEDAAGAMDGKPIPIRRYRMNLGNVLMEVEAAAADGALLRARVPIQSVAYVRRGYAPPPDPALEPVEDPRESAVTVAGPAVGLPGILTKPASEQPLPAVLLLAGSGPQDRDETVGTNKPLRDLARGLASRGIASLRYDKRTFVRRDPSIAPDLRREYVEDALAALALLKADPGIDKDRVFVAGHSLGGSVAPLLLPAGGVRGLVLLAPMVRRADQVLLDQIPFQLRLSGVDEAEIARRRTQIEGYFKDLAAPGSDPGPFFGAAPGYWRDWLALDVIKLVREASVPVLVLQGENDIQVRADADFDLLRRQVGEREGRVSYQLFPHLNHLFQRTEGPSTGAEYGIPGRMDPAVIAAAAAWILAH